MPLISKFLYQIITYCLPSQTQPAKRLPPRVLRCKIQPLYLWIKQISTMMTSIINRIIELTGWIVLGVSVILLGVASHIDNYQPPVPVTSEAPHK